MNAHARLEHSYDAVVVGGGVSGSFIAYSLACAGKSVLILEAGERFNAATYPRNELEANSKLYWSGGIELNTDADIGFLRPKCVGGGSVVNQALVDRFDADALDSWRKQSGVSYLTNDELGPWYDRAEAELAIQTIPEKHWNGNAKIFLEGFAQQGHHCAPLRRAQRDCKYEDGNDCIACLAGCPIDSKQSMPVTVLAKAIKTGRVELIDRTQAIRVVRDGAYAGVEAQTHGAPAPKRFIGKNLVLASGAIGNSKLLLASGFKDQLPALGEGFYTHPQYMNLGVYDREIAAHKGPFQALKSADPNFRAQGFKLENVFAPPVGLAMLVPGLGKDHQNEMRRLRKLACIEVAIRDTEPGRIELRRGGGISIRKRLNAEDRARKKRGLAAMNGVFKATGAQRIISGDLAIGLHLMGGLAIGTNRSRSVIGPDFRLHGHTNIFSADSSIFPNAPGINPSLTIMALSLKAAEVIVA